MHTTDPTGILIQINGLHLDRVGGTRRRHRASASHADGSFNFAILANTKVLDVRGGQAVAQSGLALRHRNTRGLLVSYRYHTNSVLYGNLFLRWGRWTKREGRSKEREKGKAKKKEERKKKRKKKERKGSPIVLLGLRHFYVS